MGETPKDIEGMVKGIVTGMVRSIYPDNILDSFVKDVETSSLFRKGEEIFLMGVGKSSRGMVSSFKGILERNEMEPVDRPLILLPVGSWSGTKQGYRVLEGNHPVPGPRDMDNMDEVMNVISSLDSGTKVLLMLSGGASSLSFHPRPGVDPDRKSRVISELLGGGADIGTLNKARTFLSDTKGGGLLCSGSELEWRTVTFSDVSGDDPRFIGSGLTYPWDPDTEEVKSILEQYLTGTEYAGLNLDKLYDKPRTSCRKDFVDSRQWIAANNQLAVRSTASVLEKMGFSTTIREVPYSGEAKVTGLKLLEEGRGRIGRESVDCFVAGGETTVKVTGNGKGGRNSEMITSLIGELGEKEIVICMGTDGVDGSWEGAGGWITGNDLPDEESHWALDNNDTGNYLKRIDRDIGTGPTENNLADIFILLHPEARGPHQHQK